jgi:hypothetical protein
MGPFWQPRQANYNLEWAHSSYKGRLLMAFISKTIYLLFSAFQCFFVLFCKKVKKVIKKNIPFTFFLAFATVQKSSLLF